METTDKPKKGFLSKAFDFAVKASIVVGAFYAGAFFDFGFMHSAGALNAGLTDLSLEFMSPVSNALPEFFASDFGQTSMEILKTTFKGIHRLFGITDTFQAPTFAASQFSPTSPMSLGDVTDMGIPGL